MKGDLGYSGLRPSTALYLLYKWHRLLGKHWTTTKEVLFCEREMGTTPMLKENILRGPGILLALSLAQEPKQKACML